jgi:predicted Zn-dependent protease
MERVDAKDRVTLERAQAELLARTGDRDAAVTTFKGLVAKYPKDATVRRRLAELLAEGSTRAEWEASLAQWRALAEGLRPDTPGWFEAKYRTAEMHARLGNRKTAARVVTVLRITRPELGGAEMKERFLKLLESVR